MIEQILNHPVLQIQFLNNTIQDYIVALVAFVAFLIILKIFQAIILKKLDKFAKKTITEIDDTLIQIVRSIKPPFYSFLAFYMALYFLNINPLGQKIINGILIVWITYQVITGIQILIDYLVQKKLARDKETATKMGVRYISMLSKIALWVIGLILILANLGVDVTSLIAGLGIGGVAIALALQNILSDLFSSLAIYFDKPFVIGDFIIVGQDQGTVEKIGIKTTRIRALDGEEIIISNQELTSARIQNFKTVKERRSLFRVGVTYDTSQTKLKLITKLLKESVEKTKLTNFDRAHFVEFADSSLNFELSFYAQTEDYKKFLDIQQQVLYKIRYLFAKEKIEMAFPTQTVYLAK
ncbi:MAG: mechanosensitive ion channel [Candidatus Buchananbacteria bacterium]|nr:mechanosensitive ion channel [Candidatus Buchananbacteria bacterium]